MSGPRRFEVLSTEQLHDCNVFRVSRALTRSPRTGEARPFYRLDAEDWVNVVPLTPEGQVVMVRQYRHGSGVTTLEIPGGIVDPGESPAEAALRELREETGYAAGEARPIGAVNPNPALFGNRVHTFLAEDVRLEGEVQNTAFEETEVELVQADEVPERILRGEIDHALVIAALHWWALHRGAGG